MYQNFEYFERRGEMQLANLLRIKVIRPEAKQRLLASMAKSL